MGQRSGSRRLNELRDVDSNHGFQNQNLAGCQLPHPALLGSNRPSQTRTQNEA